MQSMIVSLDFPLSSTEACVLGTSPIGVSALEMATDPFRYQGPRTDRRVGPRGPIIRWRSVSHDVNGD